jgi:hypothetical protein
LGQSFTQLFIASFAVLRLIFTRHKIIQNAK